MAMILGTHWLACRSLTLFKESTDYNGNDLEWAMSTHRLFYEAVSRTALSSVQLALLT